MSVVILKWNPGFSSYTMVRFLKDLEKCSLANNDVTGMNWSVWDYDQVRKGDIFYMLKVGYGQTGIVARGTITSDPYQDDDWSWRDRPTRYCDLDFDVMVNPDAYPILDSKSLSRAIPDFDWTGAIRESCSPASGPTCSGSCGTPTWRVRRIILIMRLTTTYFLKLPST